MRANTNISLKDRLQVQLTDFKGVDFSSSPLRVQVNRASSAVNLINEYGVNHKRNGWNQVANIQASINLIFKYVYNETEQIIVQAGKRFYKLSLNEQTNKYDYTDIINTCTYSDARIKLEELISERSQVFFNNGKAYIIGCGDFLVYGTWNKGETFELRRVVDNEDTYIPTTTISIDNDTVIDDTRASLDDINFLSNRRKNQMLGVSTFPTTWTVDSGEIDLDTKVEIKLDTLENNVQVSKEISNSLPDKSKLYINGTETEVGSINFSTGQITLNINTEPQIAERDNIFVTFKHVIEGYNERITKCKFGTLFGVNGNTDRLFLSGNDLYTNIDFHSEMDDYTYFGDLNTSSMGSNASRIMGYGRLSDSNLVIYKEEGQESTIFYRTGQFQQEYDNNNNLQSIRAIFPTTAGSIGEGLISRFACDNFSGDNIILSKNGVFGIVLSNNVATSERYTRERSRSINEKLKQHKNLKEAIGISFNGRYYLAIDNVCYIADSRFKYASEDNLNEGYNYEWWYWDNIPVRVWANIDNKLMFGTADGKICEFDEKYSDRTYFELSAGDLAIDIFNNYITYNEKYLDLIKNGDTIRFISNIYKEIISENDISDTWDNNYLVSEEIISTLFNDMEVYVEGILRPCFIVNVDKGTCTFKIKNIDGEFVQVNKNARVYVNLKYKDLILTNVNRKSFQLKEEENGSVIKLGNHASNIIQYTFANLVHYKNVVSKWYTPILDFGTNEASKGLLKLTISTEPNVNGKLTFGYETKNLEKSLNAKGVSVFSFDDLNFEDFTFDTSFASSYSVKTKVRNFNFIIFKFISDTNLDCAINNFTVIYKISKSNKGVK